MKVGAFASCDHSFADFAVLRPDQNPVTDQDLLEVTSICCAVHRLGLFASCVKTLFGWLLVCCTLGCSLAPSSGTLMFAAVACMVEIRRSSKECCPSKLIAQCRGYGRPWSLFL